MEPLSRDEIRIAVEASLAEDIGPGDVTTLATVPEKAHATAAMVAREPIVVAGLEFAMETFRQLSPEIDVIEQCADGRSLPPGSSLMNVRGPARAILTGERVALNFIQRLCGIATLTRKFVDAAAGTKAKIIDTRKTTPGWRQLEKYAVVCGGGTNHRFGLYDMILIKDNHLAALRDEKPNAIAAAVRRARSQYPNLKVEVEADTLEQVQQALEARADIVLLDNMSLEQLRDAVKMTEPLQGLVKLEASGGVNLSTVRGIAETGVDFISVGAITHSARAVDIGLDFK
jgi:nicotinate-nucleotide pyrophosphorylase (carboxylating)